MSGITLSAGVKQNLLSLQNTANLMATTQNRLATGKKVNSALDNPTNFFTSASLQARAGDMNSLLDSMSNGIKTLEAADNGLSAITKTVESMQSTLRQARQDKSFKTASYSISSSATGNISFSGGSVGTTGVNVALTTGSGTPATNAAATGTSALGSIDRGAFTPAQNAVLTGTSALGGTTMAGATSASLMAGSNFTNIDLSNNADNTFSFDINGDTITLTDADGTAGVIDIDQAVVAIQSQMDALNGATGNGITVSKGTGPDANKLVFTTTATGAAASVTIDNLAVAGTGIAANTTDLGFANNDTDSGQNAQTLSFDVNGTTVTLNSTGGSGNNGVYSAADIRDAINTANAGVTASLNGGGNLVLTSTGTAGAADAVTVDNFSSGNASQLGFAAQASVTANGQAAGTATALTFDVNGTTVTLSPTGGSNSDGDYSAQDIVDAINGTTGITAAASLDGSGNLVVTSTGTAGAADAVTIDNFSSGNASQLGFAAQASVTANGQAATGTITVKTVDTLVSEINANTALADKVRASNDNGKLRIENLSTSSLTVTGVTSGSVDGSNSTASIGGNDVRKNLVKQFNELRDQLNKLADDASFNGVNLLRGDKLKLTFNETGTSTMEIQAKTASGNATSVNATNLEISSAVDADFDSDATLDSRLDGLQNSLATLRSQASTFGSNLSIVQNRQDFTKNMIATLQTGADKLVLADTNEEAANMLALQTRQQLSSTALSLASQADQAALRLF